MGRELTVRERIRLKQLIDEKLDKLYKPAEQLGEAMGQVFTKDHRSQLRNLETVAGAATRSSALKNHVKNQTGKDSSRKEPKTWALQDKGKCLGERTLGLLNELGKHATDIAEALWDGAPQDEQAELARTVEIELQRGVVQTAVCAALYPIPQVKP